MTRQRVHGSRRVYTSEWLNVDLDDVEIPGGARFEHHVIRFSSGVSGCCGGRWRRPGAAVVAAPVQHRCLGLGDPGRVVRDREDPAEAVRREVAEETGYRPGRVEPMATYSPMTGISAHRYRLFLARGAVRVGDPDIAESERVEWVSVGKVPELAAQGLIPDGPSLTALTYYLTVARRT